MRHPLKLVATLAFTFVPLAVHAQEKGEWRAQSKTARAITGDVAFAGEKFGINFLSYTVAQIRSVQPVEAKATFDLDAPPAGAGNLYRLSIPGTTKFLHKNTLCGAEDTQWMVTFVTGKQMQIAFFSGETMPILTGESIPTAGNLCGTFSYSR